MGDPSASQVPLDATTIPQFVNQLTIPRVFAPTVITQNGEVIRHDYTVNVAKTLAQLLPPGFPQTNVLAYGGQVKIPGSSSTEFVRSTPGPIFENVRNIPTRVTWQNEIRQPHFLPVDPTLHLANPLFMEPPVPPFLPFPPGTTTPSRWCRTSRHTHGLVVRADMDGTAEEWFTPSPDRSPVRRFVTRTYDMPNEQPPTQLFYHEHAMGDTRLGVYAGLAGAAYFIRDPKHRPRRSEHAAADGRVRDPAGPHRPRLLHRRRAQLSEDEHQREERVLAGRRRRQHHPGQRQGVAEPERPAAAVPIPHAGRGQRADLEPTPRPQRDARCRSRSSDRTAAICPRPR